MTFTIYVVGFVLVTVAGAVISAFDDNEKKEFEWVLGSIFAGLMWPAVVLVSLAVAPAIAARFLVKRYRK